MDKLGAVLFVLKEKHFRTFYKLVEMLNEQERLQLAEIMRGERDSISLNVADMVHDIESPVGSIIVSEYTKDVVQDEAMPGVGRNESEWSFEDEKSSLPVRELDFDEIAASVAKQADKFVSDAMGSEGELPNVMRYHL